MSLPAPRPGSPEPTPPVDEREAALQNLGFAANLVRALDSRDQYSASHSAAVAVYARDIAIETGCSGVTCLLAHLAGLLHDIGKIGVPNSVLLKVTGLSDNEYRKMQEHVEIGASILHDIDRFAQVSMLVRHHHERCDGSGYPDGLDGEHIPALARIVAVADTYSAMTTDRPYRDAMPFGPAVEELHRACGGQLDAMYVDAFLRVLERESDDYRRGRSSDFETEIARHRTLDHLWQPQPQGDEASEDRAA